MTTSDMDYWGPWRFWRENWRALFHASIGITGWYVVHWLMLADIVLAILLIDCGLVIHGLDNFRVFFTQCADKYAKTPVIGPIVRILRWINVQLVQRYLVRDVEQTAKATVRQSWFGFMVAFALCWHAQARWILAIVPLLFGFADPVAKFGRYDAVKIHRFESGLWKGKSVGGFLCAFIAGIGAMTWMVVANNWRPLIPADLPPAQWFTVYLSGALSAAIAELLGGKNDNFLIPAGSAAVMLAVNYLWM